MKSPYSKTVGFELLHAARLHRARSAQLLGEIGLFPGQEQVLTLLAEKERTMGELAVSLRVRPPTASKTIARLTAQGLITRLGSNGDGRTVRVGLTEEGRRRAETVEAVWDALEAEAVAGLDAKDRRRLRKLLRKLGGNVSSRPNGHALDGAGEIEPDDEAEA